MSTACNGRLNRPLHGVAVFAADKRGFLSVEPYADWPELQPFHGRIAGPQPARETYPTRLAFMRALTEWMGGSSRISGRSRRSLEQIGVTLCGYPQLASEARSAAGQIGHVVRRLLLDERIPPYIGNMDLDDMLPTVHEATARGPLRR
jgi:tRNA threonylcarbamoyladenosine dehydratase